ncbi:response regulator transcription factor [Microbacterium barkeri]|uniref:response regulator n=1 Tax=Microbacterium barkeri TaxID=33917 RepID=UPI0024AF10A5|nr:response regulator transcription factor [Microbacterium barkeri]MDI6942183.1 response regulator transcription factor [Microbacterium barkeri]
MTIRVLVADDHAAVRAGIAAVLSAASDIEVVGEAADGQVAIRQAAALEPDVVLMDVRMPRVDGIEATAALTARGFPVLVLTTFAVDAYVDGALAAGASGYLLKTAEADEIIAGVRRVAAGEGVLAPEVTLRVIRSAGRAPERPEPPAALDLLTPREREVLVGLGAGRSNAEIARELHVSETTVKSHVSHVLAKLGVASRMAAAVIARDAGLA